MAARIRIQGIPPYNGEYDFDAESFTNRELHQLKQLTGLRVGELGDAISSSDTDVVVGLAVIALQRNGHVVDADLIWDAEMGKITFVESPVPPPESPQPNEESERPQNAENNDSAASSGDGSSLASDSQANGQKATGTQDSDTSVTSPPATLVP